MTMTTPYRPAGNGIVERRSRSLIEVVRCLRAQSGLPMVVWDHMFEYASRCLNNSFVEVPTHEEKKTPQELERRGVVSDMAFGCHVIFKTPGSFPGAERGKLEPHGLEGFYLGATAATTFVVLPGQFSTRHNA